MMRPAAIAAVVFAVASGGLADPTNHGRGTIKALPMPELSQYINSEAAWRDPNIRNIAKEGSYADVAARLVRVVAPRACFRLNNDHYVGSDGIAHVYFKQLVHGMEISNADFNVNIDREGNVFSYGHSFYLGPDPENPLKERRFSKPMDALSTVVSRLGLGVDHSSAEAVEMEPGGRHFVLKGTKGCVSDPKAKLMFFQHPDQRLSLTWRMETDVGRNWLVSYVDAAASNTMHGIVNYVSDFDGDHDRQSDDSTFKVYPWGVRDPAAGKRKVLSNPRNSRSSPFSWVGDGSNKSPYRTLRGNNAIAQVNISSYTPRGQDPIPLSNPICTRSDNQGLPDEDRNFCLNRPQCRDDIFEFYYSPEEPVWERYRDASLTQVFYTCNKYHDLLYVLGFNEEAGNFQINNGDKGGQGNDFAVLYTQDGGGINNANFATPPDGQPGRMRMYMWNLTSPERDGAFDASIVLHEFTHGLSTRLTGGPANSDCLSGLESGGMGEGWSDIMAIASLIDRSWDRHTDFPLAAWAVNNATHGIRSVPYSTNKQKNGLTYADVNRLDEVHAVGEVWATALYEALANLVDAYGINGHDSPELGYKGTPTDGRYLFMKLVMTGMAMQPCDPNMVSARDAILDADRSLTGGRNMRFLWKAFAKRGLGVGARYDPKNRTANFDIPRNDNSYWS